MSAGSPTSSHATIRREPEFLKVLDRLVELQIADVAVNGVDLGKAARGSFLESRQAEQQTGLPAVGLEIVLIVGNYDPLRRKFDHEVVSQFVAIGPESEQQFSLRHGLLRRGEGIVVGSAGEQFAGQRRQAVDPAEKARVDAEGHAEHGDAEDQQQDPSGRPHGRASPRNGSITCDNSVPLIPGAKQHLGRLAHGTVARSRIITSAAIDRTSRHASATATASPTARSTGKSGKSSPIAHIRSTDTPQVRAISARTAFLSATP